jgi:hypothetical protein
MTIESSAFVGRWTVTAATPRGEQVFDLDIAADGADLTGTAGVGGHTVPIEKGSIDGDRARWTIKLTKPLRVSAKFDVRIEGDTLAGSARASVLPSFPVSGRRASSS